jgi:cytochrome b561
MSIQAAAPDTRHSDLPPRPVAPWLGRALHWLTAILILAMFCSGVIMTQLGEGPAAKLLFAAHKTTGLAVLGLLVLRIGYRLASYWTRRWPASAAGGKVHLLLYAWLAAVPLLGWAGAAERGARGLLFGLSLPDLWPRASGHADLLLLLHACLAFGLIGLVVIHVGVALGDFLRQGDGDRIRL